MNRRNIRIGFLVFYAISLLVWIAEEIFTLTNPPDIFDRYRILIATIESFIAISSLFVVFLLYKELKEETQENELAKSTIHVLERNNRILNNPELGFWKEAKLQMEEWNLSEAEKEIAVLLLRGFSQKQIAAVRNKSLRTIENQTASIYSKSSMRGKLEFISYFLTPLLPEEE